MRNEFCLTVANWQQLDLDRRAHGMIGNERVFGGLPLVSSEIANPLKFKASTASFPVFSGFLLDLQFLPSPPLNDDRK